MSALDLATAQKIIAGAVEEAGKLKLRPLAIVVLDARGLVKAAASQDGIGLGAPNIAPGKARAALTLNVGSRTVEKRALERPHFWAGLLAAAQGPLVPVAGGVLIKDASGAVLGAVGCSGDTSDNDEAAAVAGIKAAGLTADPG
jgi:uncharacterized protein GlcG (DUF336 family)